MNQTEWLRLWQKAQSDPYMHASLALMLLNGLSVDQIGNLPDANIDLEQGWITAHDGHTYPLVSYTAEALAALYASESLLQPARFFDCANELEPLENEAHRRLAGAIWITNDELQRMLEITGSTETPILPLRFTFPFSITERLQPREASAVGAQSQRVLQDAADWLFEQTLSVRVPLSKRMFGLLRQGGLVFMVASTGVSGLNFIHNILMGRLLSPADYSQLTFIITLQLLIGLLPTALQTVVARFAARYHVQQSGTHLGELLRQTGRFGWVVGVVLTVLLLISSPLLVSLFQLDSVWLLMPIIIGMPFFVRMGTDRGMLQGLGSYFWLSSAYVTEGAIRLGISVALGYALLDAGRSLEGAVWGVAQSMLATWFISWLAIRHFQADSNLEPDIPLDDERQRWVQLGWISAFVLIGQALITNSDFLLVKNFFSPEDAGLYAAVSVLGRIIYFGALPLTIVLVPLIARRQALDVPTRPVLLLLMGGGIGMCAVLILLALVFAPDVLRVLYGDEYTSAANLLAPYALAASLYTLTNLIITYEIALGHGNEAWMPLLAGSLQIVGVALFHASLVQVISVQIILMSVLFGTMLWRVLRKPDLTAEADWVAQGVR